MERSRSPKITLHMLLSFPYWDRIPEKSAYEEERFVLVCGFRDLSPWSLGPMVFEPMVRQSIVGEHMVEESSSPPGSQEAKRKSKAGATSQCPSRPCCQ